MSGMQWALLFVGLILVALSWPLLGFEMAQDKRRGKRTGVLPSSGPGCLGVALLVVALMFFLAVQGGMQP